MKLLFSSNPAKLQIHKDSEIDLIIDSLSHGGSGVGRFNDFVIFVPFTAPGDTVRVKITSLKKNYADGELIKVLSASPQRTTPPCPVFGRCGGCQWQHVDYLEQLQQKQGIVEHALGRIAKEENVKILPIIPSPKVFHYRNRAGFRIEGSKVGFYRRQSHEIVEFTECMIVEEKINHELKKIKLKIADSKNFRSSKVEVTLNESGVIDRSLGFSQVNTLQNKNMQNHVCKLLGEPEFVAQGNRGSEGNLLDLYCGNGNFSFPLSKMGWRIYGVDSSQEAIQMARQKATPMTFFSAGDCSTEAHKLALYERKFEAIFLDPPRTGVDEQLISSIKRLTPRKLIYVSCNPTTFARDWARLKNKTGLQLQNIQPFDMFPQTFHVELIAFATDSPSEAGL